MRLRKPNVGVKAVSEQERTDRSLSDARGVNTNQECQDKDWMTTQKPGYIPAPNPYHKVVI